MSRGFSLIEITVVMMLVSAIAIPFLLNSRASSDRLRSQGLARALTEELRAARAHAAQEQTDVVLAFPSGASRSFRVYQGEDVLSPVRTVSFDQEYESFVLSATWPATGTWQVTSTLGTEPVLPEGMTLLLFRPDGTVRSNLPRLGETHCLAVGGGMNFSASEGTVVQLQSIKDPNTIVIGPSGTIELVERLYQASAPLPSTQARPTLASLEPDDLAGDYDPVVESISFFPRPGSPQGKAGLGKTYIEIHPLIEGARAKEYGMVAVEVEASDPDGGPLFLEVKVTPSAGPSGTLTSDGPVRMEYLQGVWKATIGWRPPVEADPEVAYSFQVEVSDRDGRAVTAHSDASVMPMLTTLVDNRLAVESSDGAIYLANLEGGELVQVTPTGVRETQPIWSGDGTRLYVVAKNGLEQSFVRYNADGTGRTVVTTFPLDAQGFQVDSSGMYLGFLHSTVEATYDTLSTEGLPEETAVTTSTLSVLHVSSGNAPLSVASSVSGFSFLPYENGQIAISTVTINPVEGPAFDEEGVPIEGEVAEYADIGSESSVLIASGLNPNLESSSYALSLTLAVGALNPFEPRYYTGPLGSVRALPEGLELDKSTLYVFEKRAEDWINVAELAKGVALAQPPVWSANGDWVVYTAKQADDTYRVYAQNVVLAPPESAVIPVVDDPVFMFSAPKVGQVTPTPEGEAILYIVGTPGAPGSKLMSQRTKEGSSPLQIGVNLPGVASYAITQ